jgi:hypothetical protein
VRNAFFGRTLAGRPWTGFHVVFVQACRDPNGRLFRTCAFRQFSAKQIKVCLFWEAVVRIPDHPTLIRRTLQARLKKLATASPMVAASLAHYRHRCGRAACRCHQGGPLHTGQHLTFQEGGKTRTVYVPKELLPEVQAWIVEHKRLKQLLREIHLLSVALIRTHTRQRRRQAGRP